MNFNKVSFSNEDLSRRPVSFAPFTKSLPRHRVQDWVDYGPSVPSLSSASSESDIFTVYQASRVAPSSNAAGSRLVRRRVSMSCRPRGYTRHSNLEVRPLSWKERFSLARIHYLTIPNVVRCGIVLFCLCWFAFMAKTTLIEFNAHETIAFLEFQSPNTTKPPAITICTHAVLDS